MWKIKFTKKADKDFANLDQDTRKKIDKAIYSKLLVEPNNFLIPLIGDMSGLCKFRVGDYRLLCIKEDNKMVITAIKLAHRREVYKH